MAAIGSQINPALGRIDYTPFLQGAQMAAQGQMQGVAAVSQGISQGFDEYLRKREQNSILEGKNAGLLREVSSNPQLKQFVGDQASFDKLVAKMSKGGGLTLNDNMKLNAELTTAVEGARRSQEMAQKQVYADYQAQLLKQAQADAAQIESDRIGTRAMMRDMLKLGRQPTTDDITKLGIYNNVSPKALADMLNMTQGSAEFNMKVAQHAEQMDALKNQNAEARRRIAAFEQAKKDMPLGWRIVGGPDGQQVLQMFNPVTGSIDQQLLKKDTTPSALQRDTARQEQMMKLVDEYKSLLFSEDRRSQENIDKRDKLVEQYNLLNPKADVGMNQTREGLDEKWGIADPIEPEPTKVSGKPGGTPPAKGKPVITSVSPAPAGAQPTPTPATTSARATVSSVAPVVGQGAPAVQQAAPVDTSIGAPAPAPAPLVDTTVPPMGIIPFGQETGEGRGEGVRLSKEPGFIEGIPQSIESGLAKARKTINKIDQSRFKIGEEAIKRFALNRAEYFAQRSDTPARTFDEVMLSVGRFVKNKDNEWEMRKPEANRKEESFLDKKARETVNDIMANVTPATAWGDKVNTLTAAQLTMQGVKLDPAAKKIADRLLREYEAGSNKKPPQFFLEASSAGGGRTRTKLTEQNISAILNQFPASNEYRRNYVPLMYSNYPKQGSLYGGQPQLPPRGR